MPFDVKPSTVARAAARDLPARPGPMMRNVVTRPLSTFQPPQGAVRIRESWWFSSQCTHDFDLATSGVDGFGVDQVGGQLGQGGQDETPFPPTGMGNGQLRAVEGQPVNPQHVGVESAWAPPGSTYPTGG